MDTAVLSPFSPYKVSQIDIGRFRRLVRDSWVAFSG